jgi:hypothetical protein
MSFHCGGEVVLKSRVQRPALFGSGWVIRISRFRSKHSPGRRWDQARLKLSLSLRGRWSVAAI